MKNKHHQIFLRELENHRSQGTKHQKEREKRYTGTKKDSFIVKAQIIEDIVKEWMRKNPNITINEYTSLLDSLYFGKTHDERRIAGKLLEFLPKLRKQLNPLLLDKWLDKAEGWAEVDSICQSNFSAEEMLANWRVWKKMIANFSRDKNVHKRRASLVLLANPIRHSSDTRLVKIALMNIDQLKSENDILITKAVSWLLRACIKNHRNAIKKYLESNLENLPPIAVRETNRKLLTGKK